MRETRTIAGRGVYPGVAEGEALVGLNGVPGWDAFDLQTGAVKELGNPLHGHSIKGKVLILNGSRGSTGYSTQFHCARVAGVGPIAMVFPRIDARIASSCVVARVPAVTDLDADIFALVNSGDWVRVDGDRGLIEIVQHQSVSS
jgi:predicted aconitase with swiveling domain